MEPYLGIVIKRPTKKEADEGVKPEIVLEPTAVLAESVDKAKLKLIRKVKGDYDDDRLEVRLIPFPK